MIKLIACDLDDTLLSTDKSISERNLSAIEKILKLDVKFVPTTGRSPNFLGDIFDKLKINSKDNYSILCNGACIIENLEKKVIFTDPLDFKKASDIYKFCNEKDLSLQVFSPYKAYYRKPDSIEVNFAESFENSYEIYEEENIDFLKDTPILKCAIVSNDLNYLMSLEKDIAQICNWDVKISYSSDRYMEINKTGVTKASGLKNLAKLLSIDIKDTMAIGDNYNDIEMIEDANLGVAVNNAHLLVKETADYITISSNNEGAVGEAIEKFILNKI
ncbi:MAG: HAD family hydrolase [Peptoniphilaceae bacterium]|nr:HAD family hydrolase [Peptoniphilaceae bacterium]MDD7383731.1 HAD family hydrolase [Peptoniphilaceae bacterium]MDY3737870.1 HAD family hydrolase [Peptoniphilaceae bacterium]